MAIKEMEVGRPAVKWLPVRGWWIEPGYGNWDVKESRENYLWPQKAIVSLLFLQENNMISDDRVVEWKWPGMVPSGILSAVPWKVVIRPLLECLQWRGAHHLMRQPYWVLTEVFWLLSRETSYWEIRHYHVELNVSFRRGQEILLLSVDVLNSKVDEHPLCVKHFQRKGGNKYMNGWWACRSRL